MIGMLRMIYWCINIIEIRFKQYLRTAIAYQINVIITSDGNRERTNFVVRLSKCCIVNLLFRTMNWKPYSWHFKSSYQMINYLYSRLIILYSYNAFFFFFLFLPFLFYLLSFAIRLWPQYLFTLTNFHESLKVNICSIIKYSQNEQIHIHICNHYTVYKHRSEKHSKKANKHTDKGKKDNVRENEWRTVFFFRNEMKK